MGKHLIRATRWSGRSLLLVYSRLMTLLFALFCAATGLLSKNASAKGSTIPSTVFKGTAFRASDSTVLSNIKLVLSDCFLPDYGIYPEYGVITPWYGVTTPGVTVPASDTVVTDEEGNFEKVFSSAGNLSRMVASEMIEEPGARTKYSSSGCVNITGGKDSTYTLYLSNVTTAVERNVSAKVELSAMTALQGKELQIRIPEWQGKTATAIIVNSRGQKTATLSIDMDGILRWDTRTVAKGVYLIRLNSEQADLRLKILVK